MKQRDEKAGSIPLETPVVPVSRQLSMVLKAINLPHGKIEKPKSVTSVTCFDRSSLRADERFYLSDAIFSAFPIVRLPSLHPFLPPSSYKPPILSINSCLHEKRLLPPRMDSHIPYRFSSSVYLKIFSFVSSIFFSLPSATLSGLLASP